MPDILVRFLRPRGEEVADEKIFNASSDLFTVIQKGKLQAFIFTREDGAAFTFIEAKPGDADSLPLVILRLRPN